MPDSNKKYLNLGNEYPFMVFEKYHIYKNINSLKVQFVFNLADKIKFSPEFYIEDISNINDLPDSLLNNLVFHIGMVELISYWKAACPPVLIVKPFVLNDYAVAWWRKLFFYGLGEFFYTNKIEPDFNHFLEIRNKNDQTFEKQQVSLDNSVLIPVGGGKDSAVTLSVLSNLEMPLIPFYLNPVQAAINVVQKAGIEKNALFVKRTIDPELLKMNEAGFLNGHTPFSALLAFYSLLSATLRKTRYIALSNESSANEPTIPGTGINHQYSKSYGFEKDFIEYCRKNISDDFNYFSFLRPLNELQIAGLFSGFSQYHSVFRSCNAGSKQWIWCGKCSKCLFTFIILSAFLDTEELIKIFGSNLLDDNELLFYFDQLCGIEDGKPFECVGTLDEVNTALHMAVNKYEENNIPVLLRHYMNSNKYSKIEYRSAERLLPQFNEQHFLEEPFLSLLKKILYGTDF